MPESYRTIGRESSVELTIKKSRFIGRCFPAESEQAAAQVLERTRKQYWDASHNCYAFRVGTGVRQARSSDDGEPSGTGGMPILNELNRKDVTNALCVVTRYFGGVLLGTGGLVRAYSEAASEAILHAGIVLMRSCTAYQLTIPYPLLASVQNAARPFGTLDAEYAEQVFARIWIADARCAAFLEAVRDATDARVVPTPDGAEFRESPNELP